MLTAFKTLMGIMCYCILSPPLLASAISQRSVCFCQSPSLSERISHPLLLQLLAASLLNSTIRSSPALSFILHFHSSPILHPTSLFLLSFSFGSACSLPALNFPQLVLFSCYRPPPPSILLFSYSLAQKEDKT